jgi:thiosulfate/3-mercaptopyruvate sulfurtransferase
MQKILVTTAELAEHLDDPGWVVIDARHDLMNPAKGVQLYAQGHIPGAYFMHTDEDLSGLKTGNNGRHPLPDLGVFAAKINQRGITPDTQVVVYDDLGGTSRCASGGCCGGWATKRSRCSTGNIPCG